MIFSTTAQHKPASASQRKPACQSGFTVVELMVSIAISVTVLSGVVQVLLVSKSNFITERELSTLQENARYAVQYLGDQIRMAGFSGCSSTAPAFANSINSSNTLWYLEGLGLQGYEHEAGAGAFPAEFRSDVAPLNDVIVVRRGEDTGLKVITGHVATSRSLPLNQAHAFQPGQPFVVAMPSCTQVTIFQGSGPTNAAGTATSIEHDTVGTVAPGNCEFEVRGSFSCSSPGGRTNESFPAGSRLMALRSEAYYVGASGSDPDIPALFRESMYVDTATSTIKTREEELAQGVEYMQVLYGLDNVGDNSTADIYVKANSALMDWSKVVTVRIALRMRSLYPVYNENVDFDKFEGLDGSDGSDRYMRQLLGTTIRIRNI